MAHDIQLPCDGDGVCMRCKATPPAEETLTCCTCVTPWHVSCLSSKPETLASTLKWECPDCSGDSSVAVAVSGAGSELLAAIREIEADQTLTEREKAVKRQELMTGRMEVEDEMKKGKEKDEGNDLFDVLGESIKCSFCMQLPERPITTNCGHNFCLKCFQRWIGQRKNTCAKCRKPISPNFEPRINESVVNAIRLARLSKSIVAGNLPKVYHFVHNQDRPDQAYTTERAKKTGKANACSGKIFVTIPSDHFGPIPAENDPERNQGVLVGESWDDRLQCRQWGAHFPHVAGIAGQATHGAQSVALSGGYLDDEDHGEWFLYTGSGGRDLSGNKRTNKEQSFDQKFEKMNEALRVSCKKGYPVRVVRSHKEKRSSYAPMKGVRYDGVYRIEKCWRKVGIQGHKVCRYLFVRCDNEPAPWTSDVHGDRPRPLPVIKELANASDVTDRKESPAWDFDEQNGRWKWKKPPPLSRKPVDIGNAEDGKRSRKIIRKAQSSKAGEQLLKGFCCLICQQVMNEPVTTPCAHNFCKSCLEGAFAGKTIMRDRSKGGRTLRAQKNTLQCPRCPTDISDFFKDLEVNREVMSLIETVKRKIAEEAEAAGSGEEDEDDTEEKPTATGMETGEDSLEKAAVEKEHSVEQRLERSGKKQKVDEMTEKIEDGNGNAEVVKKPESDIVETSEPKAGVKKTHNRRVQQSATDGNDSPSSPLIVRSSDDDLE